jgi:hypothetical protein
MIFASIDVFPLIIGSPVNTHMDHLLLGRGGVFFGVSSFGVSYYGSGPTKGEWVLLLGPFPGSGP